MSSVIEKDAACGRSKGCFVSCDSYSCEYVVTWVSRGDVVEFEILARTRGFGDQWIAIGFSGDIEMVSSVWLTSYKTRKYSFLLSNGALRRQTGSNENCIITDKSILRMADVSSRHDTGRTNTENVSLKFIHLAN